tara:strand:+ start:1157 stop:1438 length:282 start_codon:yes stop_codon:yes gene_type:complete
MRLKLSYGNSYFEFENGDGTRYMVHITPCEHGGHYVIEGNVKNNSLWIWFEGETKEDCEIRHLAGNDNEYTRRAVLQVMWFWWNERSDIHGLN